MSSVMSEDSSASTAAPTVNHHPSFKWIRSERIDSLNLTLQEYQHIKTGALHYHMDADNVENVFLVAFRTVPMDSTGVAHILEHTSLCGSKKYPVRDPFFMMIRRSLNTFMNAFTSSDWTAYPFASQNKKDFNNLMDVYLDAVFFTRLDELDFLQEGHRVEFKETDNINSELEYKGVVFNEMKGAMSSPVSVLWQQVSKYLYPTSTYHYNSGGEPQDIPDLSYQQLKDFHQTHYHPSNAVFMTFGDISAFEHQQKFEAQALNSFEKLNVEITVQPEKRYLSPLIVEEAYAYDIVGDDTTDDKTHHVMSWLLGPCTSLDDMMKANLLSQVLFDNSSSPLRQALEKTDLAAAPSPLCGLEDSNYEMCFLCGVEGSKVENAPAFEKLVLDVLNDVATNGVPHEKLEAVLHQLELSQREVGGDSYPFGLQLILSGLTAAIHRSDPVSLLNLDPVIESLREDIKDPEFIKNLVRELLLDNQHRVRLTLRPDENLSQRKELAEKAHLATIRAAMSDDDKEHIVKQATALAERQLQEDNPEILPKVDLQDVPAEIKIPQATKQKISGTDSTIYKQGTNGIVYHEIVCQLPALTDEELALLPYYSSCLTELGCGDKNYLQMQEWQSSVSGGIHASQSIRAYTDNEQKIRAYYVFSGKALSRNNKKLAELMWQTIDSVRFDEEERIVELITQMRSRRERSVTDSGHSLAMSAAASGLSPIASLHHQFSGLAGIQSLKALDDSHLDGSRKKELDKEKAAIKQTAQLFSSLHQKIKAAAKTYMLTVEADKVDETIKEFEEVWQQTDSNVNDLFSLPKTKQQTKQMWIANTQVNFCAKAYASVTMEHTDAAALSVLGGFLRNGYLHTAIREQGGAYGGGATQDTNTAVFKFYSYRDPRLSETLDDFDNAINWMLDNEHEARQLEEAILGVVGGMDKPGSPAGEARAAFHNELHDRTREKLQLFRQRVLEVSMSDLKRVTETYLKKGEASTAVITSAATHEEAGDLGLDVIHL
ncbi:Predicted insulinase-like Zn-dependent peptidase DVU0941 [hydrothermal vent metagenome]|uniref:Predicted insulinase-like Zn-dependent peptidase DVU0941 n=1 Tax=hydrothermal vent metagenome TaxID=652676 RepID=A0A3B0W506_9ZZZZ